MDLGTIFTGLKTVNTALQAAQAIRRANAALGTGDVAEAVEAGHDLAAAVDPALGTLTRGIHEQFSQFRGAVAPGDGIIIDGDQYLIDCDDPARPRVEVFLRSLASAQWGTFVFLGPKGSGKSTGALRLGETWHRRTGWPVYMVNAYPEDRYDFVEPVTVKAFVSELKEIVDILNAPREEDETPDDHAERLLGDLQPFMRRIIIIDEMSLTVGTSGADAGRVLVRQIMAQARHLEWLIIYIGQLCRMMPRDLLNCEAVFVKKPSGLEPEVDIQEPLVQRLWARAVAAFAGLSGDPNFDLTLHRKGWAYAFSQGINGRARYEGLMHFKAPGWEGESR